MIFEIEVSEQAEADLRGIYEYIAFELQAPDNASRQVSYLKMWRISVFSGVFDFRSINYT